MLSYQALSVGQREPLRKQVIETGCMRQRKLATSSSTSNNSGGSSSSSSISRRGRRCKFGRELQHIQVQQQQARVQSHATFHHLVGASVSCARALLLPPLPLLLHHPISISPRIPEKNQKKPETKTENFQQPKQIVLQFFYTCGCKINNDNTRKTTTTTLGVAGGGGGRGGATAAAAPLQKQTTKSKKPTRKREETKSHPPLALLLHSILIHLPNPINCLLAAAFTNSSFCGKVKNKTVPCFGRL